MPIIHDPSIVDPEAWAQEIFARTTAKMLKAEAAINNVTRKASVQEITSMINTAADHYFGDFDVDFVESCISIQMAAELRRRMQLVIDGHKMLDEIAAPSEVDPAPDNRISSRPAEETNLSKDSRSQWPTLGSL